MPILCLVLAVPTAGLSQVIPQAEPDDSIGTEDFRVIAGGRTGGSVAKMELNDLVLATPAAATPTMALSTTRHCIAHERERSIVWL